MTIKRDNRTITRRLIRVLLLALICIGGAAMASSSSASFPTRNLANRDESSLSKPTGDDCWTTISAQNVVTGGNYLFGMDGDRDTGAILVGGYYTTDLGLQDAGFEGGIGLPTQLVEFYSGSSFQTVPNPPGLGDTSMLNGVGAIPGTNNEFWLVGNATTTTITTTFSLNLIERYNGTSLSNVPNPQPSGVGQRLNDVDAASPDFAIAVGRVQTLSSQLLPVILMWNGTQWLTETAPNVGNSELYGVTTFADGRAVAVGIDYDPLVQHVIMTRDAGGTWSAPSLVLPGSGSRLLGVDAIDSANIWAVGHYDALSGVRPYAVHGNLNTGVWDNAVYLPVPTGQNLNVRALAVSCEDGGVCSAAGVYAADIRDGFTYEDGLLWMHVLGQWAVPPAPEQLGTLGNYYAATYADRRSNDGESGGIVDAYVPVNYNETGQFGRVAVQRYDSSCGNPQPSPTPGGPTFTPVVATNTPVPPTATPTPCTPGQFSDVPPEHTFYQFITCLVNEGVISGYSDCTFRPGNNITRGQLSKVVSNAAGFSEPVSGQTFEDILPGSTFYDFVERLASRSIIGGYACGGPGEPCGVGNRPYFRPNANSTRGQISKIVAVAKGYEDPTTNQTFEDVGVGSTFHLWVENLASRGIMSGYACGGPGEPCGVGNRPYFRPSSNATRGQTSKIVANTFFPSCNPALR